jgi:hypothetical protein
MFACDSPFPKVINDANKAIRMFSILIATISYRNNELPNIKTNPNN